MFKRDCVLSGSDVPFRIVHKEGIVFEIAFLLVALLEQVGFPLTQVQNHLSKETVCPREPTAPTVSILLVTSINTAQANSYHDRDHCDASWLLTDS